MSHRASLDVSAPVLKAVTGWLARYRRRPGARPAQRAGTVHTQPVLFHLLWSHKLTADLSVPLNPKTLVSPAAAAR